MWVGGLMEGGRKAPWVPRQLDPPGVLWGAGHLHSLMWVLTSLEVLAAVRTAERGAQHLPTARPGEAVFTPEEAGPRGADFSHHEMKPRETGLPKASLTGPSVRPWVGGNGTRDTGHVFARTLWTCARRLSAFQLKSLGMRGSKQIGNVSTLGSTSLSRARRSRSPTDPANKLFPAPDRPRPEQPRPWFAVVDGGGLRQALQLLYRDRESRRSDFPVFTGAPTGLAT